MKFLHRQLHQLTDAEQNFGQLEPLLTTSAAQIATLNGQVATLNGQVATLNLLATSAARAHRTAAFTLGTGGWGKIPVDTKDFDLGSNVTIASNRYVCPRTGYYQTNGQISASASVVIGIFRTGGLAPQGIGGAAAVVSDVISCVAGDYLELYAYNTAAGVTLTTGVSYNYLSVFQVG